MPFGRGPVFFLRDIGIFTVNLTVRNLSNTDKDFSEQSKKSWVYNVFLYVL
jgi:hypothetical protein